MTVARRVVIHGHVQGVGFRYAAIDAADRLGVTGWVRNRRDGTVEALLQGSDDAMAAMLEWCRHGPPHSQVRDVEVSVVAPEPLADFTLRPTA
jgi:acylphosphatase